MIEKQANINKNKKFSIDVFLFAHIYTHITISKKIGLEISFNGM